MLISYSIWKMLNPPTYLPVKILIYMKHSVRKWVPYHVCFPCFIAIINGFCGNGWKLGPLKGQVQSYTPPKRLKQLGDEI